MDRPKYSSYAIIRVVRGEACIFRPNGPEKIIRVERRFELYDFELREVYCIPISLSSTETFPLQALETRNSQMNFFAKNTLLVSVHVRLLVALH